MRDELLEFETSLSSILAFDATPGPAIQRSRYLRDRVEFLKGTFKQTVERNPSVIQLIEFYCPTVQPRTEDYGHWGELTDFLQYSIRSESAYLIKSEILFYSAALAAQQLEGLESSDASGIPYLKEFLDLFYIQGRTILLSSHGFLAKKYHLNGLVSVSSANHRIAVACGNDAGTFESSAQIAQRIRRLAVQFKWDLSPTKHEQLRHAEKLEDFYGTTEMESRGLYDSPETWSGRTRPPYPEFAQTVYPIWKPDSLGLTLSYFCNASCNHCYNASGPNRAATCLKWKEMENSLRQWIELGVNEIGISGGEPFLFPEDVIQIVKGLRQMGVERIVPFSNGYWGNDPTRATRILCALREAGFGQKKFDQIKISVGEFHQKDVAIDHVFTLCALHYQILGTKVLLDVEQIQDLTMIKKLIFYAKTKGVEEKIDWKLRKSISDSGRGRKLFSALEKETVDYNQVICPVKSRGALYPEGDWIYCTGTLHPKRHVKVGSLANKSVYGILASAQWDKKLAFLQFGSFGDYIRANRMDTSLLPSKLPKNTTPCSTCRQIFGGVACD